MIGNTITSVILKIYVFRWCAAPEQPSAGEKIVVKYGGDRGCRRLGVEVEAKEMVMEEKTVELTFLEKQRE